MRLSAPSLYPLLPTRRRLKCQSQQVSSQLPRAVKTFLRSRLIMCCRRLWNSHQRHKFLRATASRDILKFRVSEMVFPGVFSRCFPPRTQCCFVRIHARLGRMPSKKHHMIPTFQINLNLFKYVFNVIQNWKTDALQFYLKVLFFVSNYGRRR